MSAPVSCCQTEYQAALGIFSCLLRAKRMGCRRFGAAVCWPAVDDGITLLTG